MGRRDKEKGGGLWNEWRCRVPVSLPRRTLGHCCWAVCGGCQERQTCDGHSDVIPLTCHEGTVRQLLAPSVPRSLGIKEMLTSYALLKFPSKLPQLFRLFFSSIFWHLTTSSRLCSLRILPRSHRHPRISHIWKTFNSPSTKISFCLHSFCICKKHNRFHNCLFLFLSRSLR